MKRLPFLTIFLLLFISSKGQQLHQAPNFIFPAPEPVPTGSHIFEAVQYAEFQTGSEYNAVIGESLEARINPYLLFPPPGGETGGPGGLNGNDGVVGFTDGVLSISPAGGAIYTIPLSFPTATNGMEPTLNLGYNSHGGDGFLGPGWSLSGFSEISLVPESKYYDKNAFGVYSGEGYAFMLDGARLIRDYRSVFNQSNIQIEGIYFDIEIFRTEQEGGSRIELHKPLNLEENRYWYFKIYSKNGTVLTYGFHGYNHNNDAIAPKRFAGNNIPLTFFINRIEDRKGNFITYNYENNEIDGECYPSNILYSGNKTQNPSNDITPYYKIVFNYFDSGGEDIVSCFGKSSNYNTANRFQYKVKKYLESVSCYYNTVLAP